MHRNKGFRKLEAGGYERKVVVVSIAVSLLCGKASKEGMRASGLWLVRGRKTNSHQGDNAADSPGIWSAPLGTVNTASWKASPIGSQRPPRCFARKASVTA